MDVKSCRKCRGCGHTAYRGTHIGTCEDVLCRDVYEHVNISVDRYMDMFTVEEQYTEQIREKNLCEERQTSLGARPLAHSMGRDP